MHVLSRVQILTMGELLSQSWFLQLGPFLQTILVELDSRRIFSKYFMSSAAYLEDELPDLKLLKADSRVKPASRKEVTVLCETFVVFTWEWEVRIPLGN
jgi:hypothetical protein